MVETLLAWPMTIFAIFGGDTDYYIAAAIFAVAAQISRVYDKIHPGK